MARPISTDYSPYIDWINKQDLFFVNDLFITFGITVSRQYSKSKIEVHIDIVIKKAKVAGYIQKCSSGNLNPQYILVNKIPSTFLETGTYD